MKVKILGPNQTLLDSGKGSEVFFSYETPVAGFDKVLGWWKTSEHYSKTTTKHVTAYLPDYVVNGDESVKALSPEEIDLLSSVLTF
tara:strand:+ start:1611 stop:1868 length:258 start_codon:yes stop_codon:yes gene_type:complete